MSGVNTALAAGAALLASEATGVTDWTPVGSGDDSDSGDGPGGGSGGLPDMPTIDLSGLELPEPQPVGGGGVDSLADALDSMAETTETAVTGDDDFNQRLDQLQQLRDLQDDPAGETGDWIRERTAPDASGGGGGGSPGKWLGKAAVNTLLFGPAKGGAAARRSFEETVPGLDPSTTPLESTVAGVTYPFRQSYQLGQATRDWTTGGVGGEDGIPGTNAAGSLAGGARELGGKTKDAGGAVAGGGAALWDGAKELGGGFPTGGYEDSTALGANSGSSGGPSDGPDTADPDRMMESGREALRAVAKGRDKVVSGAGDVGTGDGGETTEAPDGSGGFDADKKEDKEDRTIVPSVTGVVPE